MNPFESSRNNGRNVSRAMTHAAIDSFVQGIRDKNISSGHEFATAYFNEINIEPVYEQERVRNPELSAMREKLNTNPGLLIANHPGSFDVPAVLNLLDRKDFKFLASRGGTEILTAALGNADYFLAATHDPSELRVQLREIETFISNGGLFLLFPTAGGEGANSDGEFEFRSLFRVILEKILKPQDMVYNCWINPDDANPSVSFSRHAGIISKHVAHVPTNPLLPKRQVHLDERYTVASEWQAQLSGVRGSARKNHILATHFLSLFGKEDYFGSKNK